MCHIVRPMELCNKQAGISIKTIWQNEFDPMLRLEFIMACLTGFWVGSIVYTTCTQFHTFSGKKNLPQHCRHGMNQKEDTFIKLWSKLISCVVKERPVRDTQMWYVLAWSEEFWRACYPFFYGSHDIWFYVGQVFWGSLNCSVWWNG